MTWAVLSTADVAGWTAAVDGISGGDPYFSAAYHAAYDYDGGQGYLYVFHDDRNRRLVYPFRTHPILAVGNRRLDGSLVDIETVYGYTGPLADDDDPVFLQRAWAGFAVWATERRVVSEFCRFHPLLGTRRFAAPEMRVIHDRETVAVGLSGSGEVLWATYESVLRNRVRKAQAAGLICREGAGDEDMATFREIYELTMRALGSRSFYLFPESCYAGLTGLGERLRLFLVEKDGTAIAAALFLVGGGTIHYHLGGSRLESRNLAPNNLLFHTVARWGQERGLRHLFLGGGRTNRPDDELLRFKRRFTPDTVAFHFGKRVWDAAAYASLSELWRQQAGRSPPPQLQHYRLPITEEDEGS